MPIFAPAYRLTKHQQKLESKKRKREEDDDASDTDEQSNKTDPYGLASHLTDTPLPPHPFPHAAIKSPALPRRSIEEELAALNPPLYLPRGQDQATSSLKRRHLDHLTTILHRCMLNGDWRRAHRAWALLLRTEVGGRGVDVRQNGRWGIGAELLMRRDTSAPIRQSEADVDTSTPPSIVEHPSPLTRDEGFKLAREYYDRLILQYPHTPRTQHSVNALSFYPALFNIWVYEVQSRSKRARQHATDTRPHSPDTPTTDRDTDASSASEVLSEIRRRELGEALPIARRMDDLLLSPPYDTSVALLQLRGNVALWLADLYQTAASSSLSDSDQGSDAASPAGLGGGHAHHHVVSNENFDNAHREREVATKIFSRARAAGRELPEELIADLLPTR